MYLKLEVILLLLTLWRHDVFCSLHEPPSKEKVLIGYHGKNGGKLDEIHQFQISTVYDTNVSMKSLNEPDISYLKSVLDEALLPFSSLQIKHEPLTFLNYTCPLNRQTDILSCADNCTIPTCGSMKVPVEYLGSCVVENIITKPEGIGAKAHFILFVSVGTMVKKCDKKDVYSIAAHCQQGYMDRPIAGYIDICKEKVVGRKLRSQELTHDILHTLAFSPSLYPFFRDATGTPRTTRNEDTNLPPMDPSSFFIASESTIKNVSINWLTANGTILRNVTILVTDNVAIESRTHFGCNDLVGAELEDGAGIPGFAMSHFEKRVFKNEIMTGTHNDEVITRTYTEQYVFSGLTLAVLKDSGWYDVDIKNAPRLPYAHKAGCKFVQSSCLEWAQTRCSDCFNPYCDELKDQSAFDGVLTRSCAPNGKSLVDCKLIQYTNDLEPMFQYINSNMNGSASAKGGPDALLDYCPVYHDYFGIENISSELRTSDVGQWKCTDVRNNEKENANWYGAYGEESRCFAFDKQWTKQDCNDTEVIYNSHMLGGCYRYACHQNILYVFVKTRNNGRFYLCPRKGHVLKINRRIEGGFISGSIVCPDCSVFCNDCAYSDLSYKHEYAKMTGDPAMEACYKNPLDDIELLLRLIDSNNKVLQRFYPPPPNIASSIILFNSLLIVMFILLCFNYL